jgi:hypothetical protein
MPMQRAEQKLRAFLGAKLGGISPDEPIEK